MHERERVPIGKNAKLLIIIIITLYYAIQVGSLHLYWCVFQIIIITDPVNNNYDDPNMYMISELLMASHNGYINFWEGNIHMQTCTTIHQVWTLLDLANFCLTMQLPHSKWLHPTSTQLSRNWFNYTRSNSYKWSHDHMITWTSVHIIYCILF